MTLLQEMVASFHRVMGQVDPVTPETPSDEVRERRAYISAEEFAELIVALVGGDRAHAILTAAVYRVCTKRQSVDPGGLVEIVDACSDSEVVASGTLLECGVDEGPVNAEVMARNMEKVGGGKDERGKFKKPPGWTPPDIARVLRAQGWQP